MTRDFGFRWTVQKNGDAVVTHNGRLATTKDVQNDLARLTGNDKRGNERTARTYPRNQ